MKKSLILSLVLILSSTAMAVPLPKPNNGFWWGLGAESSRQYLGRLVGLGGGSERDLNLLIDYFSYK